MMSNMNGKSWEQYMGGNVSLVAKDNSYGIALYETYRNRNPYDADGDGFSELGKLNMNTFGMRAYYRPSYNSRINIEYHTTNVVGISLTCNRMKRILPNRPNTLSIAVV